MRFDEEERIAELITQMRTRRERSVTGNGHSLAMTAAASGLSPIALLSHQFSGLAGINFVKELDDSHSDKAKIKQTAAVFSAIHEKIKAAAKSYMLTLEADKLDQTISEFEKCLVRYCLQRQVNHFRYLSQSNKPDKCG